MAWLIPKYQNIKISDKTIVPQVGTQAPERVSFLSLFLKLVKKI